MKLSKRASLNEYFEFITQSLHNKAKELDEQIQKLPNETKTANRKTLSKWAEELDEETKIPPMSRKEKWDTFERLRNRLETFNISKKQFDAALKIIEERLFGTTHNHK